MKRQEKTWGWGMPRGLRQLESKHSFRPLNILQCKKLDATWPYICLVFPAKRSFLYIFIVILLKILAKSKNCYITRFWRNCASLTVICVLWVHQVCTCQLWPPQLTDGPVLTRPKYLHYLPGSNRLEVGWWSGPRTELGREVHASATL